MKQIIKKCLVLLCITMVFLSILLCSMACSSPQKRFMEEDTVFIIDLKKSSLYDNNLTFFLDKDSKVTLKKNGMIDISIKLNRVLLGTANLFLATNLVSDVQLKDVYLDIVEELLPGIHVSDLSNVIEVLKSTLGIKLKGLDIEDETLQAAVKEFVETKKIPSNLRLPKEIELSIINKYYIVDVCSEHSGCFSGVFIGPHTKGGEPFFIMDLKEDEQGKKVRFHNEMVKLYIEAVCE